MKFRMWLFRILAALTVLYVLVAASSAGEINTQSRAECERQFSTPSQIELCMTGSDIGTGLGVTVVLCLGGFFFGIFALLAWRNGVGLRTQRQHEEMLAAQRGAGAS